VFQVPAAPISVQFQQSPVPKPQVPFSNLPPLMPVLQPPAAFKVPSQPQNTGGTPIPFAVCYNTVTVNTCFLFPLGLHSFCCWSSYSGQWEAARH